MKKIVKQKKATRSRKTGDTRCGIVAPDRRNSRVVSRCTRAIDFAHA
jgi:hypothetical protein